MRIVVIGGGGHRRTYLIPMLVERGHEVINVTRGQSRLLMARWQIGFRSVAADRESWDKSQDLWCHFVRDLKPDVVVDLICFTESECQAAGVEALRAIMCSAPLRHHLDLWTQRPKFPPLKISPRRPWHSPA